MDEKEKDYEESQEINEEAVSKASDAQENADDEAEVQSEASDEQDDSTLEEKDGVKYETNDNWTFDADAPSLNENIILENDDFKIDIDNKPAEKAVVANEAEASDSLTANENKKVINKEPLKFIPLAIFVIAVIAVLSVLGVRYFTVPNGKEGDMMNPGSVVAEVDGTKVSTGMFNYYYSSIVSYYEQYANYGYFDLDTSTDYALQYTTDDDGNQITWEDFFIQECLEEIETTTAYYNAGKEAGVTLTATQKETLESQIESLKTSASEAEVSLNEYISANFGEYCSEETLRLMLEQYYITANYKGMMATTSEYSDEEIESYFNENKDKYQQISFSYLAFTYDTTDEDTKSESLEKAKSYMSKMTDADSVIALVPEVYADYISNDAKSAMEADSSLSEEEAKAEAAKSYESNTVSTITGSDSPFDEKVTEWLFSDDTEIGSTNYYADESAGYIYVILKTEESSLLDENTYTVRHILIQPESEKAAGEEGEADIEYTKEEWAAAKKKADSILDEYNKGDKTEYSFALLAEEYSTDTASTSASSSDTFGGLYEGITEGEMVPEFESWSLDPSRKYGDTSIVKSDYGYHIMFFVRSGPEYEADIISDMRTAELDSILDDCKIKVHNSIIDNAVEYYKAAQEIKSELSNSSSEDDNNAE